MTNSPEQAFHSGFVALIGAPNAGKSTLLNQMIGEKISIVSKKPQTTRNRILGILNRPDSQIVFMDTPGVHPSGKELNVRIVETAISSMEDADVVVFLLDGTSRNVTAEAFVAEKIRSVKTPVILAVNKVDQMNKDRLIALMADWAGRFDFAAIVPISAKNGDNLDALITEMAARLPEGPPLFPSDQLTDLSARFLCAEIVREKIFRLTGEELPYASAVTVEQFQETEKRIEIYATIHVERISQKGMMIGKGGEKLKEIGIAARKDMERMLGSKVTLDLFVRVEKNWTRDTKALQKLGY